MIFWETTLSLMKDKKLKQIDLVKVTGHSSGTVSDWITKKVLPKADDAVKIACLLGVSVEYLVTGKRQNSELSPREKELLRVCSILSQDKFEAVMKVATVMRDTTMRELSAASSSGGSEHKAE